MVESYTLLDDLYYIYINKYDVHTQPIKKKHICICDIYIYIYIYICIYMYTIGDGYQTFILGLTFWNILLLDFQILN